MDKKIFIKKIGLKDINKLDNKIYELIEQNFIKLNIIHKKLLKKYLLKIVITFSFFYLNDNFINQIYLNNYRDIFSLLVLMFPYYELNKSKTIESLDELFLNSGKGAKNLESSYYIDHLDFKTNPNYLEDYFHTSLLAISNTLCQIHCMLFPNWVNIFPYTMLNYKTSDIYKNFIYLYKNKGELTPQSYYVVDIRKEIEKPILNINENYFLLGYHILYGTIYNFLYSDIKQIKWMIYDLVIENNQIIPNIIYLNKKLDISKIIDEPWDSLSLDKKINIENNWKDFYKSPKTNQISIRSLVLFYLRWEKDNETINDINISKKCFKSISTNIDEIIELNDENDEKNENDLYNPKDEIDRCLKKIYPKIKFENLYNYIFQQIHKFGYTWYGFVCMDENKHILSYDNFFNKYTNNDFLNVIIGDDTNKKYLYVTPKNIYNFCKSLIHYTSSDNQYLPLSKCGKWDNVCYENQKNFIDKLNGNDDKWFNIKKNIQRTYGKNNVNIKDLMDELSNKLINTELFVDIIFQTLVYNGMFNYYKYNPVLTDETKIPNKNLQYPKWEKHITENVDVSSYLDSYNQFSNLMLKTIESESIKKMINSKWYTNFGANWIAQIQLYHHYLHNRVMFITGATGAGKSTLAPFLLVYAVKILNFNNNARVVCTQPRTQPVTENSSRMAESILYPMVKKLNNDLDSINEKYKKASIGEYIVQNVNYIQFKYKDADLIDELYHPCLRLYTDGSLYNIIKQNYFFKKTIETNKSDMKPKFLSTNIFDVVLIDEAHEHNTYMDMILTLSKFGTYINNQITLGIISATMDNDELIYRKYFEPIDDIWKAPINIYYTFREILINYNLIDRRIHLSVPFGGMNFEVKEYPNQLNKYPESVDTFDDMKKINKKVIEILNYILVNSYDGDILIFQPGEAIINKLLVEINKNTPSDIIAVPFYSKLEKPILENIVKKIDKKDVRKKFRYDKNKYGISDINNIPDNELLPEGTYKRFIILATNIAEASITIDTFKFVIDVGNQKIMKYDPETNQDYLETIPISVPNQKQRKGRVGRVQPGTVYYTYDRTKLSEKVVYKINIENVGPFVLDLVTSVDTTLPNSKLFTEQTDPYKVTSYLNIPEFLQNQYVYINFQSQTQLFGKSEGKEFSYPFKKKDASKIIYPYSDGKYKLETLEDESGVFYIIHPNEDYFERNPFTLEIIRKNVLSGYLNKVIRAFELGKITGMIGENNILTNYGILVNSLSDFLELSDNSIEFTKMLLDCYSLEIKTNHPDVFKNILMFIIFRTTNFNFKVPNYMVGKADYLILTGLIDNSLFNRLDFIKNIYSDLDIGLKKYQDIVKKNVYEMVDNFYGINNKINPNIEEIKKVLYSYYILKFKLDIIDTNSKYILKIELIKIYEMLLDEKKNNWSKMSDQYKIIINKILLFYIEGGNFIKRGLLEKLKEQLEKIDERNDIKQYNKIINKINKSLETAIFKNDFLPKINLSFNKQYSSEMIKQFESLSDYNKLCFIIIKNFPQNILVKVPFTKFYIGYYRKDLNLLFRLEKISFTLGKKNIEFTKTKVPQDISNYFIFGVSMNDNHDLTNIMVLSELVINYLNQYFDSIGLNLFKKNKNFNKELLIRNYDDENKREMILKKIDKIIEYIN